MNVSCGHPCHKPLKCGNHFCPRMCHSDSCEPPEALSCGQTCGKPLPICGHPCPDPCHPGVTCADRVCRFLVNVYCSCRRLSKLVECGRGGGGARIGIELEGGVIRECAPQQSTCECGESAFVCVCERIVCVCVSVSMEMLE